MAAGFRLAHLSDSHLAISPGPGEWNTKRVLGWINWNLNRRFRHDSARLSEAVAALLRDPPDVVLFTGDLGQLGLAREFERFGELFEPLTLRGIPTLVVNGNHDRYGEDSSGQAAYARVRERLRAGLVPDADGVVTVGPLEILLLDQAMPAAPWHSRGALGEDTLRRLQVRLAAPGRRVRVAAGHYPLRTPSGHSLPWIAALREAETFLGLLKSGRVGAYFCGHVHRAFSRPLAEGCMQYCAGSVTAGESTIFYQILPSAKGALGAIVPYVPD